jgi:hypothetical protein
LFRSIHRGDFIVDIGRKSYTTGLPRWMLWSELLGNDYRGYAHRGRILFNGTFSTCLPFPRISSQDALGMLLGCQARLPLVARQTRQPVPETWGKHRFGPAAYSRKGFRKLNGKMVGHSFINNHSNGDDASFLSTVKSWLPFGFKKKK